MAKENTVVDQIENETKELDLKHKTFQNTQAVNSQNDDWEDIDSDSDQQEIPIKIQFQQQKKPKKYKSVIVEAQAA